MSDNQEYRDRMTHPRYTGLPTFMRAPYREDFADVALGLIGVPFDGGVTNRSGARHGPREIRNQSSLIRRMNGATGIDPHALCQIADLGDAWVQRPFALENSHREIEAFFQRVKAAGITPLSAGGDHSISLPILRAVAAERAVGMVHFDAHCDTGGDYLGSKFHHGAPFSRAVEEGLLDPKRTIQIGIRGSLNSPDMWQFSHDSGMRVIYIEEYAEMGVNAVIEEARRVVGDGATYISFDVDALDPAYAPGTGTPEIGGYSSLDAQRMIRGLRGLNLVGADVVEVSPPFDVGGTTALVGATIMFELMCVLAESIAKRKSE